MFRKVSISLVAAVLIAGGLSAVPASAAAKISNGTACSKVNATTTVSGYKYKCAKNPLVKNSKLTWLSAECLTAITRFQASVKAETDLTSQAAQLAELDKNYLAAQNSLAVTTAELEKNRALLVKFQAALAAATTNADKKAWSDVVGKMAQAVVRLSANKTAQSAAVNKYKADRTVLENAPEQYKSNTADAKASADLLCAKGF
jgi:hypothetical protein